MEQNKAGSTGIDDHGLDEATAMLRRASERVTGK